MSQQIDDILKDVVAYANHMAAFEDAEARQYLTRIRIACEALLGQERNPDLGPWSMSPDGRLISSDTFDHDVQLKVSGDFYGDGDRAAYSKRLIEQLNQAKPLPSGLPVEPPTSLLYSMAMRYRHDFGLLDDATKMSVLTTMRQLYEEVSGHGFHSWS